MCNLKVLMSRRSLFKVCLRSFQDNVSVNKCPSAGRSLLVYSTSAWFDRNRPDDFEMLRGCVAERRGRLQESR
jgi:hypothetical protein